MMKSFREPPIDATMTCRRAEDEGEQSAERQGLAERVSHEDAIREQLPITTERVGGFFLTGQPKHEYEDRSEHRQNTQQLE